MFGHETLAVYHLAVSIARRLKAREWPRGDGWLRDQAVRASGSVVLNLAEGLARGGDAGRNHLRIAMGSAAETAAVADLLGDEALQRDAAKVGRMLRGLG